MSERIECWHFLHADRRFGYGDGNLAAVGYVYSVEPPVSLCNWGLHGSERASDALKYAPGPVIGRAVLSGDVVRGDDKLVATHREYLWIADATDALRAHARWCALQVIELWDAPEIVRRYLESGDESMRSAARSAAWSAAESAAWSAAESAAWSAARSAAWSAAWSAARSAARSAAWSAAESAQNADLEARLFTLAPKRARARK